VSVGVSSLGKTSLHFVDPGTKTDGRYYHSVLLMKGLLPDIRGYYGYLSFQQDGDLAHRARETVELLKQATNLVCDRPNAKTPHAIVLV